MARSYVDWSELRTGWVAGAARPFLCGRAISVLVTPPGLTRSRTSVANGPASGRSSRRHPHANDALYSTRLLVTERFQPEAYNDRTRQPSPGPGDLVSGPCAVAQSRATLARSPPLALTP